LGWVTERQECATENPKRRDDRRRTDGKTWRRRTAAPECALGRSWRPVSRRGEDLDRDLAARPRVTSAEHLTHPARSEGRDDVVGAETGAGGERHESPSGPRVGSTREVYIRLSKMVAVSGPGRELHRLMATMSLE
jgi:hypothetical protein